MDDVVIVSALRTPMTKVKHIVQTTWPLLLFSTACIADVSCEHDAQACPWFCLWVSL